MSGATRGRRRCRSESAVKTISASQTKPKPIQRSSGMGSPRIQAPVTKGDRVGTLQIQIPGVGPANVPLVAAEDVASAGFVGRLKGAAMRLGGEAWTAARN